MMKRTLLHVAVAFMLVGPLSGCQYIRELKLPLLTPSGQKPSAEVAADRRTPPQYPHNVPLGPELDIEVIREGDALVLDNRTTHVYRDTWVFLNEQYGAPVDLLPVGRSKQFSLESFMNHHGELYPTARFLKPDRDKPLVMADLLLGETMHKLYVRLDDNWRKP